MTKLKWNDVGSRFFETGVDRGVFYPQNSVGVPWGGLINVQESPSSNDPSALYIDGTNLHGKSSPSDFNLSVEAFTYPEELDNRQAFGLCYRTKIGNDTDGIDHGYILHLVYNAKAKPTTKEYSTAGDSLDASTFTWDVSTTPINIPGMRPSAHLMIDTRVAYSWAVAEIEDILYGSADEVPRLPSLDDLAVVIENASILLIVDHGDGTWTASGPDSIIKMLDSTTFAITWPSANYIDADTYTIHSL